MISKNIKVNGSMFNAIELPLCDNSNLLVITGSKGYVMCGYLNINMAQKRGDVACMVTGVKTIDDMINAKTAALTSAAGQLGISMGMSVKEVLKILA